VVCVIIVHENKVSEHNKHENVLFNEVQLWNKFPIEKEPCKKVGISDMPSKAESKGGIDALGFKCIAVLISSVEYQTSECEPVAEELEIRVAVLQVV
jgi:hypothetical protein